MAQWLSQSISHSEEVTPWLSIDALNIVKSLAEGSVWEQFRKNEQLRRIHNVSNDEMEMLSRVALLGEIHSPRELIHILNTVRHAVGR